MILSYSKKFVFIHLDKCGGTSVEFSLRPYLPKQDLVLGDSDRLMFGPLGDGLSKHAVAPVVMRYLDERVGRL
jgi:hypothetical protein